MRNLIKSILIMLIIILLQLFMFDIFIKPIITTWGATQEEVNMPMAGDNKALHIVSTRAILINAKKSDVWKWLIQLGADRGGFYSYTFIEEAMGYKTRHQDSIKPEFQALKVGDVVRGSIDERSSIIPYNFPVIYVQPDNTFVLDNWGTFLLQKVNDQQTRLIIRTQEAEAKSFRLKVANYIIVPLHFIMERRTLMGIKTRAEGGENILISQAADIVWFFGIVFSGILICFSVFMGRGFIQSIMMPYIFSSLWLCTLLLLDPVPVYSISLFVIICAVMFTKRHYRR